jgi:glycine/D-amino acid oxidase-like deaminating enzyme
MKTTDVLIIGSGIAGATAALKLARNPQRQIILITREPDPHESNSRYAQGGIISRGLDDSVELLVEDIWLQVQAHPCPGQRKSWLLKGRAYCRKSWSERPASFSIARRMAGWLSGRKAHIPGGASCMLGTAPVEPLCWG